MELNIDLNKFCPVVDTNGVIFVEDDLILLENSTTGECVQIPYSEVAHMYGLNELDSEMLVVPGSSPQLPVPDEINPKVDNVTSQNDNNRTTAIKWSNPETKFMLNLYAALVKCVGPLKKFRTKKQMWAHLATETNTKFNLNLNWNQVETRYKCVIKRTKKAINNNNTSGAIQETTEYDDEILEIVNQDDSLCPEYAISPGKIVKKTDIFPRKTHASTPQTCSEPSCSGASSSHSIDSIVQTSHSSEPLPRTRSSPDIPSEYNADAPSCSSLPDLSIHEEESSPSVKVIRRRKKKTVQQELFKKYLEQKARKYERQEELYLEKLKQKAEREKEKELKKEKRHAEKMKMMEAILNSRQ